MEEDDDDGELDLSQVTGGQQEDTLMTGSGTQEGSSVLAGGPPLPPEINMKIPTNHFDFGTIFPQLTFLEEFHICYQVNKKPYIKLVLSRHWKI